MIYTFKNLWKITENSSNMRFLINRYEYTICEFKAALWVGISRLKPYCSETGIFSYFSPKTILFWDQYI
jgi:hypothetical protein